ncbi:Hypothetical predicted protein [Lecanosticta acicola]|uniref:Thioesterase domain-containing protein n=1 Tax=Lecanosticta acicola TaxID=111012 RepID=A0AAI8YRN4_9PEZI|nr:Hypothetical predicted protein [Lecanosticta acicola]
MTSPTPRTLDQARINSPTSHPDFQLPWIQAILCNPTTKITPLVTSGSQRTSEENATRNNNTMLNQTLTHPTGLRARITFQRPCTEPDSLTKREFCFLLSLGTGLDGASGRAHGGFSSLVMDDLLGNCAYTEAERGGYPPATATLTVDYRAPVKTPGVVLARAWMVSWEGRKIWLKGVVEDGTGGVCNAARALYINPREEGKAAL